MAEMLGLSVRLLVVRCLVFAAVQAVKMARGNEGALCSKGAASSALTRQLGIGFRFCLRAVCFAGVRLRCT